MAAGERRFEGASVLVADGDSSDRGLIASLLERIGCATYQAENGNEALALAQSVRPDAVILDVGLPGVTGYEVCHELRTHFGGALPIVFVSSSRVESLDRVAGFLIGADEYIVKPFDPDELVVRMRALLRRNGNLRNGDPRHGELDALTPREREILVLLSLGRNQQEIARELVVTPKTVATHIQRVLTKLDVHSRAEAVAFAYRHGLTNNNVARDFELHALTLVLDDPDPDGERRGLPRLS